MVPTTFTDDVTANRSSRVNSEVYRDILCAQFQPYGAKAKAAQKWPDSASNTISTQMNMFFSKCKTKGKYPQTGTPGGWRKSLAEYKEEPTFTGVDWGRLQAGDFHPGFKKNIPFCASGDLGLGLKSVAVF